MLSLFVLTVATEGLACTITANPADATDPAIGVEAGTSVSFTGSVSGNWNFGDTANNTATGTADTSHVYANPGLYTVTLTSNTICTAKVTVLPKNCDGKVSATFTATVNGLSVSFGITGAVSGNIYNWTFGDPDSGTSNTSTMAAPTHNFSKPGIYTVSLTANDGAGCTITSSQLLAVKCAEADNPMLTSPGTLSGTAGTAINFTSSVAVNWNFGDTGSSANTDTNKTSASHSYANAGTYNISITNPISGCSGTTAIVVSSSCPDASLAKISPIASPEVGTPYILINASKVSAGTFTDASQVVWKITNLNTGITVDPTVPGIEHPFNASHTFIEGGDYLISLTTTAGTCISTDTKSITIPPAKPKSVVLINGSNEVPWLKPGEAATLSNQNSSFFEYSWWIITAPDSNNNFEIETDVPITYTFPTAGTYTVKVSGIGGTGNSDSSEKTIKVSVVKAGDVDANEKLDLQDAILVLKVLAGLNNISININADANNDGKIGIEELIYILQVIAGLR